MDMPSIRPLHIGFFGGYAMGALALHWGLPEYIPPSWIVAHHRALSLGTPMVAFLLPTALALTDALLRGLCVRHPVDRASMTNVLATYDAIMLRFVVFVMGMHLAVLLGLLGLLRGRAWAAQFVPVMLGATMMSVGNLLPKTRPNIAIGIRTRRTLSDRALWIRTHRTAGYVLVTSGAIVAFSAITLPTPIGSTMILAMAPALVIATWLLCRSGASRYV